MRHKKLHTIFWAFAIPVCSNLASAQLVIDNAQFFIQPGATVTVQGDVTSNADILGTGLLQLKGTAQQNVNMNGFSIPNLEIDNTNNVLLTGTTKVGTSVLFTNGKVQLGNFNFILASGTTVTGAGVNKFLETNGSGFAQRTIGNAAASNQIIPVGAGSNYAPVSLTHIGGVYLNAVLSAQAKTGKSPNSHIRTESHTNVYWPVSTAGVTGGTFTATGTYPADGAGGFTGIEADIRGMSFNGTDWSLVGEARDNVANTVTAQLASNAGQIFGMNEFVLLNAKVLLQGPYNTITARMNDRLRNSGAYVPGVLPASNLIPSTDPYRNAPYNFLHTNNSVPESVISASFPNPFIDQANADNNIVDWVFLELRNNVTPGNAISQTRSALLQRDGDIVDIDGVSSIYFKNLIGAEYTVVVRHRNHLAMSTNPALFNKILSLSANSTTLDFSNSPGGNLMGVAGTNYLNASGVNQLYAGNANFNGNLRWSPPSSDKDYILNTVLLGNAASVLSNTYSAGDLDLNRGVRWSPPNSDKDYFLSTPLSSAATTVKSQVLPN